MRYAVLARNYVFEDLPEYVLFVYDSLKRKEGNLFKRKSYKIKKCRSHLTTTSRDLALSNFIIYHFPKK